MSKATFWYRYVVMSLWPPVLLRYLYGQAKNANVTAGFREPRCVYRFRVGRCLRGGFWLPTLTIVHLTGSWPIFLLFWVTPLLTFYPFFMQLREIAHHSNSPEEGEFTHSRNFHCHPIFNWAVFPYGQDYHLTHHVFGLIPHFNLTRVHKILLRYPPYREQATACHGYFFARRGSAGPQCWMCCLKGCLARRQETFTQIHKVRTQRRGTRRVSRKDAKEDAKTQRIQRRLRICECLSLHSPLATDISSLRLCVISLRLCVKRVFPHGLFAADGLAPGSKKVVVRWYGIPSISYSRSAKSAWRPEVGLGTLIVIVLLG